MRKALKLVAAAAAVLSMGSAQALTVAGVTWDPDSIFDFSATDSMIEKIVGNVNDVLQGYAKINTINGQSEGVFCASGCEVTYIFKDYLVTSSTAGAGADLVFSGGTIDIWVGSGATKNYNSLLASTAGDGVLFLRLAGAAHFDVSTGAVGTLHSDPTPASTGLSGDGRGFLNVVGGAAAAYFDTNTFAIDTDGAGTIGFADFQFTSSFQLLPNAATFMSDDGVTYGIFGSNDIQGDSRVPEPATIALTGLALLGVAASRRRKQA